VTSQTPRHPGPAGTRGKGIACRTQAGTANEIISPNATPPRSRAAIGDVAPGARIGSVPSAASLTGPRMHRDYVRSRARQIAYGRWQPWAGTADPVRQHVRRLRRAGASYRAVAGAAGVSPMTVCRLCRGDPPCGRVTRVHAAHARRLLAVTPRALRQVSARRDATGARRRLRALTAMGHPAVSLARRLDVPPSAVRAVIGGRAATVTAAMDVAVCELYEQIWDLRPFERTAAERRATAAARARAARHGWPPPMGLDDDRIDDPGYQPRTGWHPASGVGIPAHVVHRSSSRRGDRRGPL
jgi:AraC-like DNA-binding protein